MRSKCITLTRAEQGMILAKPVIDNQGRILCGEGKELTDKLIYRFENMGITTLFIENNEKLTEKEYQCIKTSIETRFSRIQNSFLHEFKNILLENLDQRKIDS